MLDQVKTTAIQLAIKFSESSDLPLRYRPTKIKGKIKKIKHDALIEMRFQIKVSAWEFTIKNILTKVEIRQAWRFINITPKKLPNIKSVVNHSDFVSFMDYLILRRDIDNCDADELGCLASLHTEFQNEIEKTLDKREETMTELVSPTLREIFEF